MYQVFEHFYEVSADGEEKERHIKAFFCVPEAEGKNEIKEEKKKSLESQNRLEKIHLLKLSRGGLKARS